MILIREYSELISLTSPKLIQNYFPDLLILFIQSYNQVYIVVYVVGLPILVGLASDRIVDGEPLKKRKID